MQEVYLDKFIRLLDAPGIVPGPNSEVGTILRNCIHVQKLADPVTPVETILQRCNMEEVQKALAHTLPHSKGPSIFLIVSLPSFFTRFPAIMGSLGSRPLSTF